MIINEPLKDDLNSLVRSYYRNSCSKHVYLNCVLTRISLASFLWDIGKQNSPRCDAAKCGDPSGAILFADMIFIKKRNENEKLLLKTYIPVYSTSLD